MNSKPIISIIVPCYNQAGFLPETINSVLQQSIEDWECIIVNDGSTDETEEVAQSLLAIDNRIKYVEKVNGGLSDARNFGIKKSKGKYILPLDADDKIGNSYLQKAVNELENNSDLKVVYCKGRMFGEIEEQIFQPSFSISQMRLQNLIFCSAVFRRVDYDKTGGYDTNLYSYEDWDLWLSLINKDGDVYKIPEELFFYRIRKGSMLRSLKEDNIKEIYSYICKKHKDHYVEMYSEVSYWKRQEHMQREKFEQIFNSTSYKLGKTIVGFMSNVRFRKK